MTYDCFPFFNELDVLDLRLRELDKVADRFVLVESTVTHAGRPKPLHFAENRGRYAAFADRIVHVVVEDSPASPDPWDRERHQREAIRRGLTGCRPGDLVLVSDVDEIPNPAAVRAGRPGDGVRVFEQYYCWYSLDLYSGFWHGTRSAPFAAVDRVGPQRLRRSAGRLVRDGGWHFTCLGGAEKVVEKIQATAHQEFNTAEARDLGRVEDCIRRGDHLVFGRVRTAVLPPAALPGCVRADPGRYAGLLRGNGGRRAPLVQTVVDRWWRHRARRRLRDNCDPPEPAVTG
ncbi:MAG: hypothetical protein C0501_27180 [Isosphaera sp.]|nr:hypothetical protein [Isosphaera sp.]